MGAAIMAAPIPTESSSCERDPEMHQSTKGNPRRFGMTSHIGVDADSWQVCRVIGKAVNVNAVTRASALLHGQ